MKLIRMRNLQRHCLLSKVVESSNSSFKRTSDMSDKDANRIVLLIWPKWIKSGNLMVIIFILHQITPTMSKPTNFSSQFLHHSTITTPQSTELTFLKRSLALSKKTRTNPQATTKQSQMTESTFWCKNSLSQNNISFKLCYLCRDSSQEFT